MELDFLQSDLLKKDGIEHAFFTRKGGQSKGEFASLNFNKKKGDQPLNVEKNKEKVAKFFKLDKKYLKLVNQIHSNITLILNNVDQETEALNADAIVTNIPGVVIGVITADCVPILLADNENNVIAAVHAGWRGALAGALENTVRAMEGLGAKASSIQAVLGPSIRQSVYEVDDAFRTSFISSFSENEAFFIDGIRPGKYFFDLQGYCKLKLKGIGVNIDDLGVDTYTNPDQFFSCRRTMHLKESSFGCQLSAIKLTVS